MSPVSEIVATAAPLQTTSLADLLTVREIARVLGFGVGSFVVAGAGALLYRWYTRERIPAGLALLLGLSAAGLYLGTVGLFGDLLRAEADPFALPKVVSNLLALGLAAIAAPIGRLVGDSVATDVFAVAGVRELDAGVSRLVRGVGRVTAVELPEEIGDMDGYDPVPAAKKAEMAGKTLLFPRRLTTAELRDRLVARLKEDHGVGHVDFDFDEDGAVEFLAVGSRVAGIGPTLAPGAVAVAIRADPASDASPGDRVQIWRPPGPGAGTGPRADARPDAGAEASSDAKAGSDASVNGGSNAAPTAGADAGSTAVPEAGSDDGIGVREGTRADDGSAFEPAPEPERVATGELRAAVDDVATVAVDEEDAGRFDAGAAYRLLTLPAEPQADREFASLLRAADETMGAVVVAEGSDLVDAPVDSLDATVAAVRPAEGTVKPIPPRSRTLAAGDTVYVIARPDALRRLEARAETPAQA